MSPVLSKYNETLEELLRTESFRMNSLVKAAEHFSEQERLEIASNFHKILDFDFSRPSIQDLARSYIRLIHPDADLSWIPDWKSQIVFKDDSTEPSTVME